MAFLFMSCLQNNKSKKSEESTMPYEQITQEDAKKMMDSEKDFIILDVRTPEEFASGHIKDAINIPNETIFDKEPTELTDKSQLILLYCRSGRRSKEAAKKLAKIGYTNIKEFGGIIDWKWDIIQ
ncbi:MAG: rhodanese-like domain-containing protein [Treponema sp.]|nr:rhodanese-like domain-containing protein [Treponema sp.]MBD5409393.1 rhodanese-like domain-containing protein [Treponema sp.]MBD5412090.1 rhodanese-like domain-containing protein [Treponema sp.]